MSTDTSPAHQDALNTALALQQAGDWEQAEQRYLDILQAEPDHPKANHNLGVLAVQRGEPARGLPYFQAALNADPAHGQYWLSYVDALHQAGQTADAREVLAFARQQGLEGEEVDALDEHLQSGKRTQHAPDQAEMDRLLASFNAGRLAEAETQARTLTQRFPRHAFGWKALGTILLQRKRSAEALAPMRRAAALVPDDAQAHSNLGIILRQQGRPDEAAASYRTALRLQPGYADAHYNLGNIQRERGLLDEAARSYRQALRARPDFAEAHNNLGNVLRELGRPGEAETALRQALKVRPDYAEALSNLGIALQELERLDEAEASLLRALDIAPAYAGAHGNLGLVLKDAGRLDEAEARTRRALEIEPGDAETRHNLGQILLMAGKLAQGWREYEHRWGSGSPKRVRPDTSLPQWTGQTPRADDRLLVFREQGLGDQIQFCRYLALAAEHFPAGVSYVASPSLATLLRRSFPDVEILDAAPADQSAWQWHCPLLSLPLAFGTTLDSLPAKVPYLVPDPAQTAHWRSRIDALNLTPGTRKIGLVWKPGSRMKNAPLRALTLQQLEPLLNLPGCAWFSLQKEPDPDKAPWVASGRLTDWSDEFDDFDDTAALAANLDLVISVDTSVIHLAGALALPTWLLNRRAGEWRWLHDRDDSPWYPTLRIFTQQTIGDWGEVVERMRIALTVAPERGPEDREPAAQEIAHLIALFGARQFTEAERLARTMTQRFPAHAFGWKALGTVLQQTGRSAEALAPMQEAAALSPQDTDVHNNLGIILRELGRTDEAAARYRTALQIDPARADIHYNLGNLLRQQGRLEEAEASYRNALQIRPDYAKAHYNLGNLLMEMGRPDQAETSLRRTLEIDPDYADAHGNLGLVLHEQGRTGEAEASLRRALQIRPDFAEAHYNLGNVLMEQARNREAEASYRDALQTRPDFAKAHLNRGYALREMGRREEAEASYRRALEIAPDFADAHFNLALTLLMAGRFAAGWPEYEYRWDASEPQQAPQQQRPPTVLPQWTGQAPRADDRLLVFGEQGLGDQFQFCRYLPLAAERFPRGVSFVAHPSLATLLRRSFPDVEILESTPADQSAWQWHCPLLSLPLAFGTTLDNLPATVPYLLPDPTRGAVWNERMRALNLPSGTRRIGLVWKPGSRMRNAAQRTLTLQQLEPLLNLPGCAWFSLQKEPDPGKAPWVASGRLTDWSDEFDNFDDTAALAANLDLVISVDTSVVHLAGALAIPTWLLNRRAGEWRWLHGRDDSPWYPTLRIFTQQTVGDWDEVVQRLRAALEQKS